jgi:hypothetical protein
MDDECIPGVEYCEHCSERPVTIEEHCMCSECGEKLLHECAVCGELCRNRSPFCCKEHKRECDPPPPSPWDYERPWAGLPRRFDRR